MEHFDWTMGFFVPYFNFFVFAVILYFVSRKRLAGLAQGRKKQYEDAVAAATEAKRKAEERIKELNQRIAGLETEIADIQAKGRQDAEREAEKLLADADSLAAHLKSDAEKIAQTEINRAQAQLRDEILKQAKEVVEERFKSEFSEHAAKDYLKKTTSSVTQLTYGN